jgi:imidazolonepropionase
LAVDSGGISPWHAVWAATRGGALAVGDPERGRLRPGDPADLVILDASDPGDMVKKLDANPAWRVVCNGAIVPM